MARYRKISVRIWNDAAFAALSDDGKLAFFFVLTHPHMTPLGAMRATVSGLAEELDWTSERLAKAFREASAKGLLMADVGARCVFLPNFIKHNPPESPNVVKAWEKCLDDIPECDLKTLSVQSAMRFASGMSDAFSKACESLVEGLPKSMPYQEQEQEQEKSILSSSDDSLPAEPKPKAPAIPYDDILAAYHEALPMLPAVRLLSDARRKKIKSRWHELAERQTPEYWRGFFAYAAKSDFLTGRNGKWTACNFDWLLEPSNHLKVAEGNYENGSRS